MSKRLLNSICAAALAALILAAGVSATAQTNTQGGSRRQRSTPASSRRTSQPRPARRVATTPAQTSPQSDPAVEQADLAITARVTARELRFEKVPNPKVEFTGKPRRETLWETERENLPEQVQPGVTYRDIGIRLRITSVFADIERIVAEALGEVPPSDDPQPPREPQQQSEPPDSEVNVAPQGAQQDSTPADQTPLRRAATVSAPSTYSTSPATAPATDKETRQRRGTTRKGRGR